MRIISNIISRGGLLLCLLMLSLTGWAQNFTVSLANPTSTSNTLDVDVMLTVNAPGGIRLASVSAGINYSVGILNGGTPCSTLGCGSWALVPGTNIGGLLTMSLTTRNGATAPLGYGHLRIVQNNNTATTVDLPQGTYRVGTFRFTNTVPWTASSNAQLWLQPTNTGGLTNTIVGWYAFGTNTPIGNATSTSTGINGSLNVTHTAANTLSVPLNFPTNVCATSGSTSNLVEPTCFGGSNGSATITMAPVPSTSAITYSVDGGASTPATLVAGAFNVSGLSAGSHSIVVSNTGCSDVTVPVTISGPAQLTNTTTQTACDSYTWSVTGQSYTTSGTYTGTTVNGNGCTVNETLNLTINHSTSTTETQTACDSYTWAANGQTYMTSGTYTNTTTNGEGCPNVATLILTINQSTTTTDTQTACDSYTWAANGQTYTTSGTYTANNTNASGCPNAATLILTVNHSTTSSETQTACNSYTWPANGQTYTTSGTYTATTTNGEGCPNVATLILTINTASTAYYADADNDGFGAGAAIFSCTGQPAGTVLNNTDCAPADPLKWRTANLYVDADNDGYYNGNPETTAVCYGATLPTGYTSTIIGTDCDDANPEANPNHVEIPGNSIDDNCDGATDEVGPQIGIIASQCGTTLSNVAATIYSNQAAGAQGYRFEVTNGANVRTYDSATNSFSLMNLAGGVTYATTYSIRVAVKTGGFWRSYSSACNITTPSVPATTNVIASLCGTTLTNMANMIYVNQVTAANQYRYEVTNVANAADVRTFDSALNRFSLTNLSGTNAYGATYSIRVALRFGTTWEPYGSACNITTPSAPGVTNLIASQCGITISNRWASLYANQVPDAQGYRFEVNDGNTIRFVDRAVSNFALGQVQGGVAANTVYTVRVAVLYNSVYGAFGSPCTVTTSGGFTRQASAPVTVFAVKSYPNPFAESFRLDINSSSEEMVSVAVYDMVGKMIESRQINVSEFGAVEIGSRYASGVYNVIVTQGENVETLRVIKR